MSQPRETILCGIINATPDSFSDGGKFNEVEKAVERAGVLIADGASMLDIGGESTRPGSDSVDDQEEIERIVPIIKTIKATYDVTISVDTWKSHVARAAVEAGADIINDITGLLGDAEMARTAQELGVKVIAMFNPIIARPNNNNSKKFRQFGSNQPFSSAEIEQLEALDIVSCMMRYFEKTLDYAQAAGLTKESILLDPGIGFGMTKRENYQLLQSLDVITEAGYDIFLGVSRKRFIVNTLETAGINVDTDTEDGFFNRDLGSAMISAIAAYKGVRILRVHTVAEHRMAVLMADHITHADQIGDVEFDSYR